MNFRCIDKILSLAFLVLVQACSNTEEVSCPLAIQLQPVETEKLKQIVLNNNYLSGCVTESISDLRDLESTKLSNQCSTDFAETLSYVQWEQIYNSCMVE